MEIDGETREVAEGDAILIPPGAWHELQAGADGVRLLCCCVPPVLATTTRISRMRSEYRRPALEPAACGVLRTAIEAYRLLKGAGHGEP